MPNTASDRWLTLFFRIAMGWTFLYAGLSQLADPQFTAATFLNSTKTFHSVFVLFASPAILPFTNFLVVWGHTLIGVSLLLGLCLRFSSVFGIFLMITYYFAHMDFPYIEGHVNFIMDFHLVYGGVLVWLMKAQAGHVWGLDAWLEKQPFVVRHQELLPLLG